ncbi:MAG: chemotaxis protein, partial [Verrucomicrobiota bacterium]
QLSERFQTILNETHDASQLINEVSTSSQEQRQGIEQINTAVSRMDQVTQENAASSEETASAASELNSQSEKLQETVQQLEKLVGKTADSPSPTPNPSYQPKSSPFSAYRNATPADELFHSNLN